MSTIRTNAAVADNPQSSAYRLITRPRKGSPAQFPDQHADVGDALTEEISRRTRKRIDVPPSEGPIPWVKLKAVQSNVA
jgi:hypothetical protein